MIIAQEKGRGTKEKVKRNFGMTRPEGYRKALRLMKLAEKFDIPVLTLIDTPGPIQVLVQKKEDKLKQLLLIFLRCLF